MHSPQSCCLFSLLFCCQVPTDPSPPLRCYELSFRRYLTGLPVHILAPKSFPPSSYVCALWHVENSQFSEFHAFVIHLADICFQERTSPMVNLRSHRSTLQSHCSCYFFMNVAYMIRAALLILFLCSVDEISFSPLPLPSENPY